MIFFSIFLFVSYLIYLYFEKSANDKCISSFKYVIHVNGIRGKTSVCRLIDSGLRNEGYRVYTKTTGTTPLIIDVNNQEHKIIRKGPANIKEQLKIIKKAYKQNADILIIECMAVNPELQKISQEKIIKGNISIVTNVRPDHILEMGNTLDDIANSLSNTISYNGVFFTSDKNYFDFFKSICDKRNTKAFLCLNENSNKSIVNENYILAAKVCSYIGVNKNNLFDNLKKYTRDFGSHKLYEIKNNNNEKMFFLNLFSVNDPLSTKYIYNYFYTDNYKKVYLVYNHRHDRPDRLILFIKYFFNDVIFDHLVLIGENLAFVKRKLKKYGIINYRTISKYADIYDVEENSLVIGIGNIKGYAYNIIQSLEGENN